MKRFASISLYVFLATTSAAAQQDVKAIRNFLRVNSEVCTGGQPTVAQLTALKADGITTIINLRPPQEYDGTQEAAKAKELGLRYFNIPFVYLAPKDEQATEFLKLMDDPQNRPAFIHCAAGIRVAAFWTIYRVLRDGWTVGAAQEDAGKIASGADHLTGKVVPMTDPRLQEFALQYIKSHPKTP